MPPYMVLSRAKKNFNNALLVPFRPVKTEIPYDYPRPFHMKVPHPGYVWYATKGE